jgi:uncharacterized protein
MTSSPPTKQTPSHQTPPPFGGLEAIAKSVEAKTLPPVESWNPPYCGDIGLEILRDATWQYQGSAITRAPLVALFASVLRKDEDGQTYLVTPAEKVLVRVADAPFLAVEMQVEGASDKQVIHLRTNLDEWVGVSPQHPLRFEAQLGTGGLKPYVRVRGRLDALLTRAIYLDLVTLAEANTAGGQTFGVWSAGLRWSLEAPT